MQTSVTLRQEDMLAAFSATRALKSIGITNEQLGLITLSRKYQDDAIDDWPLRISGNLAQSFRPNGEVWGLARSFALYRYALIEGPQEEQNQVPRALELCALHEISHVVEQGRRHAAAQQRNARKNRGFVYELQMTMKEFGVAFHRKPEIALLPMRQRWHAFFGVLSSLDVTDRGEYYEYDFKEKKKTITYRTFAAYSKIRPTQ